MKKEEKLFREFHCVWVTYYPHLYPQQCNPNADDKISKLFKRFKLAYSTLAENLGIQFVLELDLPMFIANFDPAWEDAVRSSQDPANKEFIEKACKLYRTLDYYEFMDFLMEDLEDEYFGPLSDGFYGLDITEEQAEKLIGEIADGR